MVAKTKNKSPEMDLQETNSKITDEKFSDTEGDDHDNNPGDEIEESEKPDSEYIPEPNLADCETGRHKLHGQVMLDVNRCAGRLERIRQVYFHRRDDDEPPEDLTGELELERIDVSGKSIDDLNDKNLVENVGIYHLNPSLVEDLRNQRELKRKLAQLIVKLLEEDPELHYYQGFHDVCLTYMTMLGHNEAFLKLRKLIKSHFHTFMQPTLSETTLYLDMLTILIGQHDKKLEEFLEKAEVGTIFALSWVITWFSHVIPNEHDVEKIFKFLEKKDPHMVLYLSAEIVLSKREDLMSMEPEMSIVHHFLCQIPRKGKLNIDELIEKAELAFEKWSPGLLERLYDEKQARKKLEEEIKLRNQLTRMRIKAITSQLLAISGIVKSKPLIVILFAAALSHRMGWWSWWRGE